MFVTILLFLTIVCSASLQAGESTANNTLMYTNLKLESS